MRLAVLIAILLSLRPRIGPTCTAGSIPRPAR